MAAGETVTLTDYSGGVVLEFTAEKQFQHLVVSLPELAVGESYTISAGSLSEIITLKFTTYANGGMGGMMGGGPSNGGGMGGQRPQDGQTTNQNGEPPQAPPEQQRAS